MANDKTPLDTLASQSKALLEKAKRGATEFDSPEGKTVRQVYACCMAIALCGSIALYAVKGLMSVWTIQLTHIAVFSLGIAVYGLGWYLAYVNGNRATAALLAGLYDPGFDKSYFTFVRNSVFINTVVMALVPAQLLLLGYQMQPEIWGRSYAAVTWLTYTIAVLLVVGIVALYCVMGSRITRILLSISRLAFLLMKSEEKRLADNPSNGFEEFID